MAGAWACPKAGSMAVSAVVFGCVIGLVSQANAQSVQGDVALDFCPNAKWQSVPFTKDKADYATFSGLINGFDTVKLEAYAKQRVVPKVGANAFFFALAALFLVIFIIWRLFRYCCVMCCCKQRCIEKRAEHDVQMLLFGRNMKILKIIMLLFGIASCALAFSGMGTVDKTLAAKSWTVIGSFKDFGNNITGTLDHMLATIGSVSGVIDDFQKIITDDVNIPGFRREIGVVQTYLNLVIALDIAGLDTKINTQLKNQLTALSTATTTLSTSVSTGGTMHNHLTALVNAPAKFRAMHAAISDLKTKAAALPAPGSPSDATWQGTNKVALDAFQSSLNAAEGMRTPPSTPNYWTDTDNVVTAIDYLAGLQTPSTNPFTDLKNKIAATTATITALSTPTTGDIAMARANISVITTNYTTANASITWVLNQLVNINNTVFLLDAGMQSAYENLNTVPAQLGNFFTPSSGPTPAGLDASLNTFSTQISSVSVDTTAITDAETTLNNAPFGSSGSPPNGATYKTWLARIKTDLTNMQSLFDDLWTKAGLFYTSTGCALAGPPATCDGTGTKYDDMYNAAPAAAPQHATFLGYVDTIITSSPGTPHLGDLQASSASVGVAPADPDVFKTAADTMITKLDALTTGAPAPLTAVSTYSSTVQGYISGLPDMTPLKTILSAIAGKYQPTTLSSTLAALDTLEAAAVTAGNSVKAQVTSTVTTFRSGTDGIKNNLFGKLNEVESQYKPATEQYDGYRYQASMALYGVSVLFIIIILLSTIGNYHWGAQFGTFCLLIVLVLYFLLATIGALLLVGLSDACANTEPLILEKAPGSLQPVLRYYFYNQGTGGVKGVLKNASIADIDSVQLQITTSKNDVIATLAGRFVLRAKPMTVIKKLNDTIDVAMADVNTMLVQAGYDYVNPLYGQFKGLICCSVPDTFASMWTALTYGGVLGWILVFCTFFYIGKIDDVPRRDCCGCTCHTYSMYSGDNVLPIQAADPYVFDNQNLSWVDPNVPTAPMQAPSLMYPNIPPAGSPASITIFNDAAGAHVVVNTKAPGKEGKE